MGRKTGTSKRRMQSASSSTTPCSIFREEVVLSADDPRLESDISSLITNTAAELVAKYGGSCAQCHATYVLSLSTRQEQTFGKQLTIWTIRLLCDSSEKL